MATAAPKQFMSTSGETQPVWVHTDPPSNRPQFPRLTENTSTDVCIIGSGISGIQCAYELVKRGHNVVMLEARETISGETGRTSGHLASALDDRYLHIAENHGPEGAKLAADSHTWAIKRVGEVVKELSIECGAESAGSYGIATEFKEGFAVKEWDGKPEERNVAISHIQATFHPTKYVTAVLAWLKEQASFICYTHTRVMDVQEKGLEMLGFGKTSVTVTTDSGHTVECSSAIMATCVPLQKLSMIVEMEFMRTYCIAVKSRKNDCLIVGGCDRKVGQEETTGLFSELLSWTRERFTHAATTADYTWSGQVFEPVDYMAFIGLDPGTKHTYIVTGDSGNGLTHGVIAGRLLADLISGEANDWSKLHSPSRKSSLLNSAGSMLAHDAQDLTPGSGGVLNKADLKAPVAVYKNDRGGVHKFSALCPHLKGVVCWNAVENSWDCPVHGSRFSKDGICVMGPAKADLVPADEGGEVAREAAVKM